MSIEPLWGSCGALTQQVAPGLLSPWVLAAIAGGNVISVPSLRSICSADGIGVCLSELSAAGTTPPVSRGATSWLASLSSLWVKFARDDTTILVAKLLWDTKSWCFDPGSFASWRKSSCFKSGSSSCRISN